MLKQIRELTPIQKARMLSLAIIHLVLVMLVWGYTREIYEMTTTTLIEPVDDFYVDGEDMSGLVNLAQMGFEGLMEGTYIIGSMIGSGLLSLVLLIPWRCIAIRKTSMVTVSEYKMSFKLVAAFVVVSLLVGVLASDISYFSIILMFIIGPALMSLLVSVLSLENI